MTKSLSNILKNTNTSTLAVSLGGTGLTSSGNTGNILVSTGTGWASVSSPIANTTTFGAVKVDGTTIIANNGVISANSSGSGSSTKTVVNLSSAYTIVSGDNGKVFNCIANTFAITLSSAITLGNGFSCNILNSYASGGITTITITPFGGQTVGSKSTWLLRTGEGIAIISNGANWIIGDTRIAGILSTSGDQSGASPASAGGNQCIAMGWNSSALNIASIAFGNGALATGDRATCIGTGTSQAGGYGFAAGYNSTASGGNAVAIGSASTSSGSSSVAIGASALASGADTIAIGSSAQAITGTGAIALGNSRANGINSFAVAVANNTGSFGATGRNSIAIGVTTWASAANTVAIGSNSGNKGGAWATAAGAIAFGSSQAWGIDSFAANIGDSWALYGAGGTQSLCIGSTSKASGVAAVSLMAGNIASGAQSFNGSYIGTTSGTASTAFGWSSNCGGSYAFAVGYKANGNGIASVALGGSNAVATEHGKIAFGCAWDTGAGNGQAGKIVLGGSTTTTTAVVLTSNGSAASTNNQLIVLTNQAMTFTGMLIAKQTASANMASYMFKGAIVNNGGTVSISSISVDTIVDTIGLGATPTFTADNTNKALAVTSGYKSATSIRWFCSIDSIEVVYA
jgi:hypothetical protein